MGGLAGGFAHACSSGFAQVLPQECPSDLCTSARPVLPFQPITMMRNALGREEGGSGVPLDKGSYEAATAYWQAHAAIQ